MWFFSRNRRPVEQASTFLAASSYSDYRGQVQELADTLPWLGEAPFEGAKQKLVPRPAGSDLEFVRRVMLSWLIGRPVSQVAKRVGCSPRLAQRLVREFIYVEEQDLEPGFWRWVDIGLVAPVDGPKFQGDPDEVDPGEDIDPDLVPLVCLVCHRMTGGLWSESRRYDGRLITRDQTAAPRARG